MDLASSASAPAADQQPPDVELPCRICLQEGSLNIYDSSFDTEDGETRVADAIEAFSLIAVRLLFNSI